MIEGNIVLRRRPKCRDPLAIDRAQNPTRNIVWQVVRVWKDFNLDWIGMAGGEEEVSGNPGRHNRMPTLDLKLSHCVVADPPVAGDNFLPIGVQHLERLQSSRSHYCVTGLNDGKSALLSANGQGAPENGTN